MATYGYSTPYTGRGDTGPLPPGYMEAATAPGRNLAMGIAAMGQGLGKAIEQYRTKKAETEAATQSWETVSGLMQQQLSSDPKYLAIQQYMETGALPQGVSEQDIPRYTQQVQADREMLNKFSALGEKFPDMSLAKKKAALGDAVMVLNQYRTDQQNQVRDALAQQQLAMSALQLRQARAEEAGQKQLPEALRAAYGVQAGQAPSVPFRSVTSELLSQYANLTPAQQAQVASIAEQRAATPPAGLVPTEAVMKTPSGAAITYSKPVDMTVTSQTIPGTNKVQAMLGGKPIGSPIESNRFGEVVNAYLTLPESLQKVSDNLSSDLRKEKAIQNFSAASAYQNQIDRFVKDVGTDRYTAADDIALIFSFMKTLDPGSTVREGEFATAEKAGGVPERIWNLYNKIKAGEFLTNEQRMDYSRTAKKNLDGITKEARRVAQGYARSAKDRGIPEFLVLPEGTFESALQEPAAGQPADERKTSGGVNYRVKRN
jgi:hypothetical protein